jgi:hypothetical protein
MPELDLMRNRPQPHRSFLRRMLPWLIPLVLLVAAASVGWYGYMESMEDDPATPAGPVVVDTP